MRDPRDDLEESRTDAPAGLFFSRRGNWFHDGDRIFHKGLSGLLDRSVARADDDSLIVTTGRDVLPFVAEDAPLIVTSVDVDGDTVLLHLNSGATEALVGALTLGRDDRWRVAVGGGRFWALMTRSAAQALEPFMLEEDGGVVVIGAQRHPIVMHDVDWAQPPSSSASSSAPS